MAYIVNKKDIEKHKAQQQKTQRNKSIKQNIISYSAYTGIAIILLFLLTILIQAI